MDNDFGSARFWAKEILLKALREGDTAVDATMGNGNDTRWLCEAVGASGKVYAFDVQSEALGATQRRLVQCGLEGRAELLLSGHENMKDFVPEGVRAVMFNLGWLPRAEHVVTTKRETTLRAVQAALDLLAPDGVVCICIYPGHEEGALEREALLAWAKKLDETKYDVMLKCYLNQSNSPPLLLAIHKK